ncbi:MAG: hypothetical protein DI535_16300 [Citrobacter freundii]|nr:MAG: hypothetical protein DI535_16300 [Citrobacter freundii]
MNRRCIIIIDPQKDFTSEEGVYAKRHPQIHEIKNAVKRIQQLLDTVKNYELIVVYSNYKQDQFEEQLLMCIPGTEGHELGIDVSPETIILCKSEHSAFSSSTFADFIRGRNYEQILLGGFLAEYCIKQTALDALKFGYATTLISDCIATGDDVKERVIDILKQLQEKGATIISSGQL